MQFQTFFWGLKLVHVKKQWIDADNIKKPNVSNPPKNHNYSDFILLKAETWKDTYILYENVKVIMSNLIQTFVLLLIFIFQEVKQIIWLLQP